MIVIGIAGSMCSGKDTIAEMLEDEFGFVHISTSEFVRRELKESGNSAPARADQTEFANNRRQRHGAEYFVRDAIAAGFRDHPGRNLVLSGIYCVGEARYLTGEMSGILVGVSCPDVNARWERIRRRNGGSRDAMTYEEFLVRDRVENSGSHDYEPNVEMVLRLANVVLSNEGSIEEFRLKASQACAELVEGHGGPERHDETPLDRSLIADMVGPPSSVDIHVNQLDTYDDVLERQRRHVAYTFLKNFYSLDSLSDLERSLVPLLRPSHSVGEIGNQFGTKLIAAFMMSDPSGALKQFREIMPSTVDEEMALLLNDTEFLRCHSELLRHLSEREHEIHDAVVSNLRIMKEHDRTQFNFTEKRGIREMLQRGVTVRVYPESLPELRENRRLAGSGMIPVIEMMKTERMLEVNGLRNSKVAQVIHDAIDHVWLFSLLEQRDMFRKYRRLFDGIGNPEHFDMFRREGEIVASIGFGVRYWGNVQVGFTPLWTVADIVAHLERLFDDGCLEDHHMEAFRHVRCLSRSPLSREAQSLGFVFSNYLVELDEQRRKHGRIKFRDMDTKDIIGELNPWGPDYLCFLIETHRELLDSRNKHRDNVLRAHILLEEFLVCEENFDGAPLVLPVPNLDARDYSCTTLPHERVSWMAKNYGFTAVRDPVL